jgi:hypothetical protein
MFGQIPYSRDMVLRKLRQTFPAEQVDAALHSIDAYGSLPHHGSERERVQLAAIRLSEGKVERLRELMQVAAIDFRDLLLDAEYRRESDLPIEIQIEDGEAVKSARTADRLEYMKWLYVGKE